MIPCVLPVDTTLKGTEEVEPLIVNVRMHTQISDTNATHVQPPVNIVLDLEQINVLNVIPISILKELNAYLVIILVIIVQDP